MARSRLRHEPLGCGLQVLIVLWLLALVATVANLSLFAGSASLACPAASSSYGTGHVSLLPLGIYCTYDPPNFPGGQPEDETGARFTVLNTSVQAVLVLVPLGLVVRSVRRSRRGAPTTSDPPSGDPAAP